jgi:hypothetical protein
MGDTMRKPKKKRSEAMKVLEKLAAGPPTRNV